mmetsp:Transcript_26556/g.61526  ORF Transcript_26556/g.61526 Transcript_26556/m.61526 type:complete len:214 (+) Transcript_26556:406-1047(+)
MLPPCTDTHDLLQSDLCGLCGEASVLPFHVVWVRLLVKGTEVWQVALLLFVLVLFLPPLDTHPFEKALVFLSRVSDAQPPQIRQPVRHEPPPLALSVVIQQHNHVTLICAQRVYISSVDSMHVPVCLRPPLARILWVGRDGREVKSSQDAIAGAPKASHREGGSVVVCRCRIPTQVFPVIDCRHGSITALIQHILSLLWLLRHLALSPPSTPL